MVTRMVWASANEGALLATAASEAAVVGAEVGVFGVGSSPGGLGQGAAQPVVTLGGTAATALAGTLVVAGTDASPGSQVTGVRKPRHVGADLSQDRLGATVTHTWDRLEQGYCIRKRERIVTLTGVQSGGLKHLIDAGLQLRDHLFQMAQMLKVVAEHEAMMLTYVAAESLNQLRDLVSQPPLR